MIDIQKIKVVEKPERKTVLLTIKVTKTVSDWLKEKKYSPTGIFMEAIEEVRKNEPKANPKK